MQLKNIYRILAKISIAPVPIHSFLATDFNPRIGYSLVLTTSANTSALEWKDRNFGDRIPDHLLPDNR